MYVLAIFILSSFWYQHNNMLQICFILSSFTLSSQNGLLFLLYSHYVSLTPFISFFLYPSLSSVFPCICSALGTLPFHQLPPWSTSRPQLWRALGPWSGSRASNSPSLTSLLRVPTTPQSPRRVWASCTQAQAGGATVGARGGSGGVRLEPPGTEEQGQADQGQIQAAGTTWWSKSEPEVWMLSRSCKYFTFL